MQKFKICWSIGMNKLMIFRLNRPIENFSDRNCCSCWADGRTNSQPKDGDLCTRTQTSQKIQVCVCVCVTVMAEVEGNCEIVELKHKYEILNVLLERKCRKLC